VQRERRRADARKHTDGTYTVLPLAIACGARRRSSSVGYTLFADSTRSTAAC
jgi:hypothetical protein